MSCGDEKSGARATPGRCGECARSRRCEARPSQASLARRHRRELRGGVSSAMHLKATQAQEGLLLCTGVSGRGRGQPCADRAPSWRHPGDAAYDECASQGDAGTKRLRLCSGVSCLAGYVYNQVKTAPLLAASSRCCMRGVRISRRRRRRKAAALPGSRRCRMQWARISMRGRFGKVATLPWRVWPCTWTTR